MTRERLDQLTDRWRRRHEAARPSEHARPAADPEREALAARVFPFREVTPAAYVADHGASMTAFTYDVERYADPVLDEWILEVGRLLRELRR
jgi:hypothetical protein